MTPWRKSALSTRLTRGARSATASTAAFTTVMAAETKRVRADAERTLTQARADNARERDELRADLRARAERAEHQANAYRAELDRLRARVPDPEPAGPSVKTARRGTRGQAAQPRAAGD